MRVTCIDVLLWEHSNEQKQVQLDKSRVSDIKVQQYPYSTTEGYTQTSLVRIEIYLDGTCTWDMHTSYHVLCRGQWLRFSLDKLGGYVILWILHLRILIFERGIILGHELLLNRMTGKRVESPTACKGS